MAKVFVINGVRCVPETNKLTADQAYNVITNSILASQERAELTRTILEVKANEILKSL